MTEQESALIGAMTRMGISVTPNSKPAGGWGWSIESSKIVLDWQGPHSTPAGAAGAAMDWLLEYARKGLLCHHVHSVPVDDDPLAPWMRFFETWDVAETSPIDEA